MIAREAPASVRKLLLVDDTPEDRAIVRRMLRKGSACDLSILEASSVEAALRIIREVEIDCVLLDHNLPDGHGVDVLNALQSELPVASVYLTNVGVESAAVAALRAGAQDFLLKDSLSPELVWRAVENAIERVEMVKALAESERRLRVLSQDLERRVSLRTEALQKAMDELSGFTYSVSHDLRAPIRAIVSSSRILIEDYGEELSAGAIAELDRQAAAGEKLGHLVDDLLDYARLGGERMRRLPVDLTEIATDVAKGLSVPQANGEGATFIIQPGLHAVADPAMIEIALHILFDNAGKYRRKNAPPKIELFQDGEAFCVRDDGIGFDMRFVDKLFRPFERLHRDQDYVGTGIGLANAKRIVERHGGRIWAESVAGVGSNFCFTLGA